MAEIKPVYYPGEEKLVSLDVLKLYRGEDVVRQEPVDVDPDLWVDEVELTELGKKPVREVVLREMYIDPVNLAVLVAPEVDIPMIFKFRKRGR